MIHRRLALLEAKEITNLIHQFVIKRLAIVSYYILRDSKVVDDIHSDEVCNIFFLYFLQSNNFGPF